MTINLLFLFLMSMLSLWLMSWGPWWNKEHGEIRNLAYYIPLEVIFVETYNAAAIALASRSFTDWISYW